MLANNIWELLGKLIEKTLFLPFDFLRKGVDGWWISNIMSWVLIFIGFVSLYYWMNQMYKFKKQGKEDQA